MLVMTLPFSRRRFLKTAAATGAAFAAPLIIPASALGLAAEPPPSQRITVGMIGVGRQARGANMRQFLGMPDVQVVAVCDVDTWRLANAQQQVEEAYGKSRPAGSYKGCKTCNDFREILARKDVDAVMISTPDHWHVPMALTAMEAGKDVSLEKPITRSIGEGRKLADAAKKLQRIFRVDSELRSYPHIVQAAELVRNGRIGKVHTVTVGVPGTDVGCPPQAEMPVPPELDYERWQGPAPHAAYTELRVHKPKSYERPGWMRHLYYCDGMITNWTTHWNDGAMFATGLERTGPVEIEGSGEYPPADSFWNVLLKFDVKMRFANGVEWTYRTEKPYFKIEGTAGWIYAEYTQLKANIDGREGYLYFNDKKTKAKTELMPAPAIPADGTRFYVKTDKQDFIDSVKSRQETLEPAEVGHRVTSLGHLGQIAIQLRQKLKWDPDKERFLGNDAANAMIDKPIHSPPKANG
jgi:myo-inositol 2-dehydrogenase / D-chiro-inositol 1-dehydrogenase